MGKKKRVEIDWILSKRPQKNTEKPPNPSQIEGLKEHLVEEK